MRIENHHIVSKPITGAIADPPPPPPQELTPPPPPPPQEDYDYEVNESRGMYDNMMQLLLLDSHFGPRPQDQQAEE